MIDTENLHDIAEYLGNSGMRDDQQAIDAAADELDRLYAMEAEKPEPVAMTDVVLIETEMFMTDEDQKEFSDSEHDIGN